MKDYLGCSVEVGDIVIFNEPNYHNLVNGKIIKFTPKSIKVTYYLHDIVEDWRKRDAFIGEGQFVKVRD